MTNGVDHGPSDEAEAFLRKTPAEQNLSIWLRAGETNGAIARAIEDIAKLVQTTEGHDRRLRRLEDWQIKVAAIIAAAVVVTPTSFFVLAQIWNGG